MSNEIEYLFFEVTRGSPVWESAQQFLATRNQQFDARQACMKKYGASGAYGSKHCVLGLVFDKGNAPDTWRRVTGAHNVWTPKGPSKEAKAIRQEFQSLPLHDFSNFQELLGCNSMYFMQNMSIHYMFFEFIGDAMILRVPDIKSDRWKVPEGCTRIPESEVVRRKEIARGHIEAPAVKRVPKYFIYSSVKETSGKMRLEQKLLELGFQNVYEGMHSDEPKLEVGSPMHMRLAALQRVEAIQECDVVIIFKSRRFSAGTCLGMGLMAGKRVVIIEDDGPDSPAIMGVCVEHPLVHEFANMSEFLMSDVLVNIQQEIGA